MRIMHCADIHLGRRRLEGRLPDTDFAVALTRIVTRAIEWKADVFLLAGDLFDTPHIPPPVLRQAVAALALLKKAKIPVFAIEGNHDRQAYGQAALTRAHEGGGAIPGTSAGGVAPGPIPWTWVRYLAEEGLLRLLSTPFTAEGPQLTKYDPQTGQGSFLELGGVRFVGAGYLGAGTNRKIHALVSALPPDPSPTVLLLHAGPEYFVGEAGGFDKTTLALLKEKIAYLALGHIHKPMAYGDEPERAWAVNPGAPENCRLDEATQTAPRGWAEIELDPHALPGLILGSVVIRECPRRPVVRLDLEISSFGNKLKEGAEAITAAAVKAILAKKFSPETVVRLFLIGELNIGRIAIEPLSMGLTIAAEAQVAGVEINLDGVKLYTGRPGAQKLALGLTTAEIERLALEEGLRVRPVEDLEERIPQVVEFCGRLKELVARGAGTEAVLELLETSPLPGHLAEERKKSYGTRSGAQA